MYTDASGSLGFEAFFGKNRVYGPWPEHWKKQKITFLELFPKVLAVCLWGDKMRNNKIWFHTDNQAIVMLVEVINKQRSREKHVMVLVRKLSCLNNNIVFRLKHVPGTHNELADALSRFQIKKFHKLILEQGKSINESKTEITDALLPQNWDI